MALREFLCATCNKKFEQITSSDDPDRGRCPGCGKKDRTSQLISRFAVGGRGDLRESTFHGCHDHDFASAEHNHAMAHDHDHSHSDHSHGRGDHHDE